MGGRYALFAVLTGNIGRSGGGFSVYVGQYKVRVVNGPLVVRRRGQGHDHRVDLLGHRADRDMHPDVPYPKSGFKALVCTFANMFAAVAQPEQVYERLDELELIVVVDHQMTDTAAYADVVLPATTWYEKLDLTATPLHPFLQLQQPAIEPVGESRASSRCGRRS